MQFLWFQTEAPKIYLRCSRAASCVMKIRTEPCYSNAANPTACVAHRNAKKYYEKLEEAKPKAAPKAVPKASQKPPEETEKPRPAKKAKAAKPKK